MPRFLAITLAAFVCVAFLPAQEPPHDQDHDHASHWLADFDKAVTKAKAEKKDLLVDFTGSDWCGWCIRLDKEVFAHHEFLDEALKNFVLVALDFPRGPEAKAKVPNEARNKELQDKYGIRGFPSILLMTADGDVYGRTGYQEGGPAKYVEHLEEFRTKGRAELMKIMDMVKAYETADEAMKKDLTAAAVKQLAGMDAEAAGADRIGSIVKTAIEMPDLQEQAVKALLKTGQEDEAVTAAASKLDPKNEKGILELVVKAKMGKVKGPDDLAPAVKAIDDLVTLGAIKDAELAKELYANAAFWNHQFLKNAEAAKSYAEKLKAVAGDDPRFARLFKMISDG